METLYGDNDHGHSDCDDIRTGSTCEINFVVEYFSTKIQHKIQKQAKNRSFDNAWI